MSTADTNFDRGNSDRANSVSRSTLSHHEWMALAAEEYQRIAQLLATLSPAQWNTPTDCAGWKVRDIVAHLIGAAEATAAVREQLRQQRLGSKQRGDRQQIDAVNDIQVREHAGLGPDELRERFSQATQRGLRTRTRTPYAIRAIRFPFPPPVGWASLGYLNDTIYTRDAWMHRIDICRATGMPMELTQDHDAVIVADAARAWQRAGGAAELVLTGPAGTSLIKNDQMINHDGHGRTLGYDAIDFARALSGRIHLPGVQADVVLF